MMRKVSLFSLIKWTLLVTLAAAEAEPTCENMAMELGLKDWVVENGGAFHEQLEFQRKLVANATANDTDAPARVGIFAKQKIAEGDLIMKIPSEVTLKSTNNNLDKKGHFSCSGILAMMKEVEKGEDSFYAPYMNYLKHSTRSDMMPSAWSWKGRELLMHVLGWQSSFKEVMIPPQDPVTLGWEYHQKCRKRKEVPEEEEDMALEYHTRAGKGDLVPLLDMVGHGRGDAENVRVQLEKDEDDDSVMAREVYATRDIAAGEEIRYSYYEAEHVPKNEHYGTPEFFRDHGIVEDYPQRWIYAIDQFVVAYDLKKADDGEIVLEWLPQTKNESRYDTMAYFRRQLQRMVEFLPTKLEKVAEEIAHTEVGTTNEDVPKAHELAAMQQFAEAIRIAVEKAKEELNIRQLELMDPPFRPIEVNIDAKQRTPNFHESFPTYNEQDYGALRAEGWETVADVQSAYQRVEITANHENVCFVLDNEPQTCSYFSAHYHDIASHFPTRYLESVKRVAILGGGDSKILQDMLQYNSTIEKVVHLELDQVGTRLCFKHFLTDPHFEDDRIEWYFGDAAKSLRMLPSDYFGTFDLVFVDMSESGPLSFGVTKDLTVWDSIAQLLNPNGMLVKNELYHEIMSEKFDNTLLLYYEQVPIIESWALTIGTNRKDLLTPDPATITKWQDVKTHLSYVKAAADDVDDHFRMAHDYKRNDARTEGKCGAAAAASSSDNPLAGVMMVLEAEELDVEEAILSDWTKFESKISATLVEEHGLSILSTSSVADEDGFNGVVIMKEGVITARTSIAERYCAFDIQLWSYFDKLNTLRDGLSNALGSNLASSYRLITTGVRGTDSEAEDQKKTGPPGINNRDCSTADALENKQEESLIADDTFKIVVKGSLEMIQEQANGTIAVLCDDKETECLALDAALDSAKFKVEAMHACSSIQRIDASQLVSPEQNTDMLDCHDSIVKQMTEAVVKNGKVVALVLDSNAPRTMVMILDRILMSFEHQENLLAKKFTILSPMKDSVAEDWKYDFLEMVREELVDYGHLFRADVSLQPEHDKDFRLALLSGQDPLFFPRLVNVTNAIQENTGIPTTVEQIEGGVEELDLEQSNMEWLHESAYTRPAGEHFKSQRPLAEQTLVQYQCNATTMKQEPTAELIEDLFQQSVDSWEGRGLELKIQKQEIGDGLVMSAVNVDATAVLIWDGDQRLDLNVLVYEDNWLDRMLLPFEHFKPLERLSFDYLPRGVGQVVNFENDLIDVSGYDYEKAIPVETQ